MKKIILSNKIRCRYCNDIIESLYHDDFKRCKCGKVAAYGGLKDLLREFKGSSPQNDYEELSEWDMV